MTDLRSELMIIAGSLAEGEVLTREQNEMPLSMFVTRLCADPAMPHTVLALIAVTLAKHIEQDT